MHKLKFIFLIVSFLSLGPFACMPYGAGSYEQLRLEVLNSAKNCSPHVRQNLEQAIEGQRHVLTEEQMIKSLQSMKEETKC